MSHTSHPSNSIYFTNYLTGLKISSYINVYNPHALNTRYKGPRGYQHVNLTCMLYTYDLAKFCTGTTLLIDKYMYISIHNTYIHNYYTLWYTLHTHTSGGLSTESFVVVLLYTCTQRYYHTVNYM